MCFYFVCFVWFCKNVALNVLLLLNSWTDFVSVEYICSSVVPASFMGQVIGKGPMHSKL